MVRSFLWRLSTEHRHHEKKDEIKIWNWSWGGINSIEDDKTIKKHQLPNRKAAKAQLFSIKIEGIQEQFKFGRFEVKTKFTSYSQEQKAISQILKKTSQTRL